MEWDRGNKWNKTLNKYLGEIGMTFEDMVEMKPHQIRKKINEYDSKIWEEEMRTKTSLGIYKRFKKGIKDERIYDNRRSSDLLFRARSNTLALNIEKRHKGGNTECELCHTGDEDIRHFMLECWALEDKRNHLLMRKYWKQDKEEMIGDMLFDNKEIEKVKEMIDNMWHKRQIELKKIRNQRQNRQNRQTN